MSAWISVRKSARTQDQVEFRLDDSSGKVQKQVIETWIVQNDSIVTAVEACSASHGDNTIPVVGSTSTIGTVSGWKCVRVFPRRSKDSPYVFDVQVEHEIKQATDPTGGGSNIWDVDIQISGQKFVQPTYVDRSLTAILNPCKKPFDPTLTRTYYDEKIEITYKTKVETAATLAALRGTVNSDAVSFTIKGMSRSFTARQMLLDDANFSSTELLADDTPIWVVKIVFITRVDTFDEKVLNRGWQYINASGNLVNAKDDDHQIATEPVLLALDGTKLAAGVAPTFTTVQILDGEPFSGIFTGL